MAVCLLLYVLILQLSGPLQVSTQTAPLKCGLGFKLCTDGSECILYSHVCDGEHDCKDGSDEEDCAIVCNKEQFQCAHGKKCIDQGLVCDGIPHCQDRSDELSCTKENVGCAYLCDDESRCLPSSFLCDGERDCLDGTDETHCEGEEVAPEKKKGMSTVPTPADNAGSTPFNAASAPMRCPIGSQACRDNTDCVLYNHFCDGEVDCKDGSDEDECSLVCETGQFQCAHGTKCIDEAQVCDGIPQCQDRSDELECTKLADGCAHQCDKSHCLPVSFLCDGERDCLDGSDEANCAEKICSTSEFKCTSGQCASASIRCDGHPDCWDRSDEEGCTEPPVCPTKHRCLQSKECLVQEWICDGDKDCEDGMDEKDCPVIAVKCGSFQWSCASKTECIPTQWKCDGTKDCGDGSDESGCGAATCHSHQFQCGSRECLAAALVCNGIMNCADGSDEGGSCHTKCRDAANCSQTCYSTPQGTKCGCEAGFLLLEDGVTCIDIDECEAQNPGVCSHLCINAPGSYQCQCHTGYIMVAGQHCKSTGEPVLLASVQSDLFLLGLHSGSLNVLLSSAKKAILSVDYDWKEQKVYWVSLDSESIMWSSLDQKTKGTLIRGVRSDSVAVDWLGRNLYWIDGVKSEIVAAKLTPATKLRDHCVILDEDLDQPRALALLPQKGLMFWTDIGNVAKIERAGMDGLERRAIVSASLGWPGGVAVDVISNRVYWTDERLKAIGSATLEGDDVKILQMKETTNPFSLAVFNDMIYWSDAKKRTVQAANKVTGKNHQVLTKRLRQPFGVKIIHPLLQTGTESPCAKLHCSHVCALAQGLKAVCRCPPGLLLAEDGLTCSSLVNSAFLLMPSLSTVTRIYLPAQNAAVELKEWPEHLTLPLPNVTGAAMLDYSLRDHTLFLIDAGTASLYRFKLKEKQLSPHGQLLQLLGDAFTAMALDWVTLNVYWSSGKQPRLQATSAGGAHTAVLIKEDIGSLRSIALHPPSGRVCFINAGVQDGGTQAAVECARMDGTERGVVWNDSAQPTSLVFSNNGEEVYWADMGSGVVSSVLVNGSGYKDFKVGQGLTALAQCDDMLLWLTVNEKSQVWYRDGHQQNKLWFEVSTSAVSLKAYSNARQTGSSRCTVNNGDCQHLCLATPGGRTCKCAHDHVLVNGTRCAPEQRCPAGSRPCLDGVSCRPREKFCNRHADCPDHSDENCVYLKVGPGSLAIALTQPPRSSSRIPPSHHHEHNSTLLNASSGLRNLDAQSCRESRCSGNGDCVESDGEVGCTCSLGYHGNACEDHLLKTTKGPIVYGAGALFGAVVLAGFVIAVVKRWNAKIRKASHAAKENGNMSELEIKETVPATQSAESATELTEEVASSVA